jgi:hypothetical protein
LLLGSIEKIDKSRSSDNTRLDRGGKLSEGLFVGVDIMMNDENE